MLKEVMRRRFKKNETKFHKDAFTLIQAMIVMMILSISLLSSTYLIQTVTLAIGENKQRITALYLGKECMELTRNFRDSAQRQQLDWDCAYPNNGEYELHTDFSKQPGLGVTQCDTDLGGIIKPFSDNFLKRQGGRYQQGGGGTETLYKRKLSVSEATLLGVTLSKGKTFTCEVSWERLGESNAISFTQILTDWK